MRQKGIDERGFADPRLPGDKHHLALAPKRPLQGVVQVHQLRVPADEWGGRLQGRRTARFHETRDRPGGGERGDEPVASPAHRFDKMGVLGVIPQHPPQRAI
jgi:hypothetical protein